MTTNANIGGKIHEKTTKVVYELNKRQLRMGPAPFASFEDLSDEVRSQRVESPEDKQAHLIRLPGIHEDVVTTPGGTSINEISENEEKELIRQRQHEGSTTLGGISLIGGPPTSISTLPAIDHLSSSMLSGAASAKLTPCTPRIDISRASSSSHHEDSKDSTPENQAITALGVGFREEGALELRSSTEELDFQDSTKGAQKSNINKSRPTSPLVFICDPNFDRQRKDSQTSEICLLSISGRTSRLSSVGSQCSDHSRISTTSHLSVMSGQSGLSRSTSPHKMLLETSFCGSRANLAEISQSTEPKDDGDVLEKVLLARKHDPREAILGEGITIETKTIAINKTTSKKSKPAPITKPARTSITSASVTSKISISTTTTTVLPSITIPTISIADSTQTAYEAKYVTAKGEKLVPGQTIKTQSGTEFTFIPLKGPLPKDFNKPNSVPIQRKRSSSSSETSRNRPSSTATDRKGSAYTLGTKSKSTLGSTSTTNKYLKEPEYIRIKLKPDYMYNEEDGGGTSGSSDHSQTALIVAVAEKPKTLNLSNKQLNKITVLPAKSVQSVVTSSSSPLSQGSACAPPTSLSRKSSLLRSRETISPAECPTTPTPTNGGGGGVKQRKSVFTTKLKENEDNNRDRSRSRSKSRERNEWSPAAMSSTESIDSGRKQKSSVFSIFKPKKTLTKTSAKSSAENLHSQYETGITNVEFTFDTGSRSKKYHEQLLEGDSIRIPLHSPSEYENRTILSDTKTKEQIGNHVTDDTGRNEKNKMSDVSSSSCVMIETQQKSLSATNSEDSSTAAVTVIEATPTIITDATAERRRSLKQHNTSSTSSENVVFTTKLGSNEEIFTTKLPKKLSEATNTIVQSEKSKHASPEDDRRENFPQDTLVKCKENLKETIPHNLSTSPKVLSSVVEKPKKPEKLKKSETIKILSPTPLTSASIPTTLKKKIEERTPSPKVEEKLAIIDGLPSDVDISNRNSIISTTANEETSENSENDSEIEFINKKTTEVIKKEEDSHMEDHERKTLVFQTDSFDDELPYIPTTLPLERSVAIPIVPIRQRSTFEMKTRPIERPRSTTPINPSTIDDYCGENTLSRRKNAEKLRISLPREDTVEKIQKIKSPRKGTTNPKAWQEFAEKAIVSTGTASHQSTPSSAGSHYAPGDSGDEIPPPLPPRGGPKEQTKQWINFEEIPEKHKPPKRIQTIPSRSHIEVLDNVPTTSGETVIYNYVNPEDCQCECHETASSAISKAPIVVPIEEIEPLLQDDDSSDDTMKQSSSSSSRVKTKR